MNIVKISKTNKKITKIAIKEQDCKNLEHLVSDDNLSSIIVDVDYLARLCDNYIHKKADGYIIKENDDNINKTLFNYRKTLGDIIEHLNSLSSIFKSGMRGQDMRAESKMALYDIDNLSIIKSYIAKLKGYIDTIQRKMSDISEMLLNINSAASTDNTEYFSNNYFNQTITMCKVIKEQIDYINSININESQLEAYRKMATQISENEFPEEVQTNRMSTVMRAGAYDCRDKQESTLKIIREVLQNACDAINKVQKQEAQKGVIKLDILSHNLKNDQDNFCDLIIEDNGIGMDWNIISNKFFVYFASGKESDENAVGGFGVAKALIQDTPKQGWSIKTNDIYTSKYHKDIYNGTKKSIGYTPPKLEGNSMGGVRLTLFHIPYVDPYVAKGVAEKFSSLSNIEIYVNNKLIKPLFNKEDIFTFDNTNSDLNDEQKATENIKTISNIVGETEYEKQNLTKCLSKTISDNLFSKLGNLTFPHDDGTQTSIKFAINKITENWKEGNCYVFLNGQYQFDNSINTNKINLICFVSTNTKPGDIGYPVTINRDALKAPYSEAVKSICNAVRDAFNKASEDVFAKEELTPVIFNREKSPITFTSHGQSQKDAALMSVLSGQNDSSLYDKESSNTVNQNVLDIILKMIASKRGSGVSGEEHQLILDMIKKSATENAGEINYEQAKDIVDMLATPCAIITQNNFIASDIVVNKKILTAPMMLIINKIIKVIGDKLISSRIFQHKLRNISVIGGIVYSDKCLGLCKKSPDEEAHIILVNPMSIAQAVESELMDKEFGTESYDKEVGETSVVDYDRQESTSTPTNRLSNFLYHVIIHEICHASDPYLEDFHSSITMAEILCQDKLKDIRDIVKEYMPELRQNTKKLITVVKKAQKKRESQATEKSSLNLHKISFNFRKYQKK